MEKGGLHCFSFFLLVLGTVPRVFNSRQALCVSPAHFSFLVMFLIMREISLSCPGNPWACGSHTQDYWHVPPGLQRSGL